MPEHHIDYIFQHLVSHHWDDLKYTIKTRDPKGTSDVEIKYFPHMTKLPAQIADEIKDRLASFILDNYAETRDL